MSSGTAAAISNSRRSIKSASSRLHYLALLIGPGGAIGTWLEGHFSDRLGRRDVRWSIWLICVVVVASEPFVFGFLLLPTTTLILALFIVPASIVVVLRRLSAA